MNDETRDDEARILESFRVCRAELHHELGVLSNRLNSYITSQAFLVSGYAISMGNVIPGSGREFRLIFPLILSMVAILLSLRAQPGIAGACSVISQWHERQAELFERGDVLADYFVLRNDDVKEVQKRNLWFSQTSPWIFGVAWLLMAVLAIYLHAVAQA